MSEIITVQSLSDLPDRVIEPPSPLETEEEALVWADGRTLYKFERTMNVLYCVQPQEEK